MYENYVITSLVCCVLPSPPHIIPLAAFFTVRVVVVVSLLATHASPPYSSYLAIISNLVRDSLFVVLFVQEI